MARPFLDLITLITFYVNNKTCHYVIFSAPYYCALDQYPLGTLLVLEHLQPVLLLFS